MSPRITIDKEPYERFQKRLKVSFKNIEVLVQAFIHRSYLNENTGLPLSHNERLEFLGDAVLELVITHHLFIKFPNRPEGDLTAFRSALVNTKTISQAATDLGMNDLLLLSRGEQRDTGKARQYILANTFEALIGALYLDLGYPAAEKFIEGSLYPQIDEMVSGGLWRDAKSYVQEKAQEVEGVTPSYNVLKETGPDHDKNFTVGIFFKDIKIGEGRGKSKQEAEQEAALRALEAKNWNDL